MGDRAALVAAGHDVSRIATRVIQLFLQHALRDGFFHADMHHGNLKVGANGDVLAYDFGIMGEIDAYTRRIYAEILMGFIRRDYRRGPMDLPGLSLSFTPGGHHGALGVARAGRATALTKVSYSSPKNGFALSTSSSL